MAESIIPNFDGSFCGKQPLHNTNQIQPHAALIVLDRDTLNIVQVSENVSKLVDIAPEDLLGQSSESIFTSECYNEIRSWSNDWTRQRHLQKIYFSQNGISAGYIAHIDEKDDQLMFEIYLSDTIPNNNNSYIDSLQNVKILMAALDAETSLVDVCKVAATEIKKLSGFDKVMIYCFDEDWNGSVLAEAKEPSMEAYLGLKFPASDIPKPARELYLRNPFRFIPNREYSPVKLIPQINPGTHTLTNLSDCKARSVATVHLEYLRNMNVMASMSTRIIYREKLWGLISCHHREPKYLNFEETAIFEFISNILSARISSILHKISDENTYELNNHFNVISDQSKVFPDLMKLFSYNAENILRLLSADGAAICWNNQIQTRGVTPEKEEVLQLRNWLREKNINKTLHLTSLSVAYPEAESYAEVSSGFVALPIEPEAGNYVMAFRREAVQQVKWGGNPHEALNFEGNTKNYHPRNSFEVWKQTVKKTSPAWTTDELVVVEKFRNLLVEYSLEKKNQELLMAMKDFSFMADILPQLIWTAKADGWVDFFNERWYSFTGKKPEECLGHEWISVIHPEDLDNTLFNWNKAVSEKKNYEIEYRIRKHDGSYSWFLGRGTPSIDDRRNIIKWFGTCTNIDNKKKMEQILEKKVSERTVELATLNQQLEKSNSDLIQYAFIASHDLQEPVRKIQVFGNLLKEKYLNKDPDKTEEYLGKILHSSSRMKNLISDLLSYSSISSTAGWKNTDLNEVVKNVLTDLELLIAEKEAMIDVGLLPLVSSREGQMRQVFQNLISNSLYYVSPLRRPHIIIKSRYLNTMDFNADSVDIGPYVECSVQDNGVGFEQQYSDKIFQIFQRLQPKGRISGTGIGLSIVKRIIEYHKGIITALGEENIGATFKFIIPVAQ